MNMPLYISLIKWTQKGITEVQESYKRLDKAKELFKMHGAEIKEFYLTTGVYDIIVISECPDDSVMASLWLHVGKGGAIRSETSRIFSEDEYRNIIDAIT